MTRTRRPPERKLTLVALFRKRPPELQSLIDACIDDVVDCCGTAFVPYLPEQIHATVIGLESVVENGVRRHRNLTDDDGACGPLDLDGFAADLVRTMGRIDIRFGGFAADATPFASRGRRPFERGFSIQGTPGTAVLMGWPEQPGSPVRFPEALDALRRRARRFGIAHAYHLAPGSRDNDLYMRLGLFQGPVPEPMLRDAEARVRTRLARTPPVRVAVTPAHLHIVAYDDPTLPPATTTSLPLATADLSPPGIAVFRQDAKESG
jgi:hypothetical protein